MRDRLPPPPTTPHTMKLRDDIWDWLTVEAARTPRSRTSLLHEILDAERERRERATVARRRQRKRRP
jgi:hypothetical protein